MTFDLEAVRARFPALRIHDAGRRRIYFDNPAGTQVPATVAERMSQCLLESNANLGGGFRTSELAGQVEAGARSAMADLLNAASTDEIVFGQNMTTLTFHLSRSIGRYLKPGDELILTRMDHDANVQPWRLMARDFGLEVRWLEFDRATGEFDLGALDTLFSDRTRLVCVGGASNLIGTLNDVKEMTRRAHATGAWIFVDAVQSVPHVATDVQAIGCDFLACSAYKFFGPHQGILYGRREALEALEAYKVRPAPDELPWRFETGTSSIESMAGTTAAVDYLAWIGSSMAGARTDDRRNALKAGMDLVFEYEQTLSARLIEGLENIPGVTVHGVTEPHALRRRLPTVAFTHERHAPSAIAAALAHENIFVWNGHNYAIEAAKALGIYESGGAVRVGPVHYNGLDDIDALVTALGRILA